MSPLSSCHTLAFTAAEEEASSLIPVRDVNPFLSHHHANLFPVKPDDMKSSTCSRYAAQPQPMKRKKTGDDGCFWLGRLISSDGVLMIKGDFQGEIRTLLCPSDLMASSSCQKSQPVIDPPALRVRTI